MKKRERQPFEHEIRAAEERGYQRGVKAAETEAKLPTPAERLEFVNALRDCVDEGGDPAPMISLEDARDLLNVPAKPPTQPDPEARCPDCGGPAIRLGGFQRPVEKWDGNWSCEDQCVTSPTSVRAERLWRKWSDTKRNLGRYYWYDGSPKPSVVYSGGLGECAFTGRSWVIGPLNEPTAPVES